MRRSQGMRIDVGGSNFAIDRRSRAGVRRSRLRRCSRLRVGRTVEVALSPHRRHHRVARVRGGPAATRAARRDSVFAARAARATTSRKPIFQPTNPAVIAPRGRKSGRGGYRWNCVRSTPCGSLDDAPRATPAGRRELSAARASVTASRPAARGRSPSSRAGCPSSTPSSRPGCAADTRGGRWG